MAKRKISRKQQAKMQRARKRKRKTLPSAWDTMYPLSSKRVRSIPLTETTFATPEELRTMLVPMIPRTALGAPPLTRGGLVINPQTGESYRLSPATATTNPNQRWFATRQPGTVYDADADGWIPRDSSGWDDEEYRDQGYDVPEGDETSEVTAMRLHSERAGWGPQAVEIAARLGRKRTPRPDTCDETRLLIKAVGEGARGVSGTINCGHKAGMIAVQAKQLLLNNKCARATKHIRTAFKFCTRKTPYGY